MIRYIVLFAFAGLTPLQAQSPRSLEVRTLCFGYSNRVKEVTLAGDAEGQSSIDCKLVKYLEPQQKKMTVSEDFILIGEPGANGFDEWSKVKVEKGITEALLVFFPLPSAEQPYKVVVLDDSSKEFPLASFQIANMSPKALRLIVGENPIQIQPGETKLISKFKNQKANGQVSYFAYYQDGEEWKRLSTGFWDVIPTKRNLQIAFGNPKSKTVEMRGYEDGLPVLKALLQEQQEKK